MYEQYIEDELEELGIEAELEDTNRYHPEHGSPDTEIEPGLATREIVRIVPFQPGNGLRQNHVNNYVTPEGEQFYYLIKERPQCPSCEYILSGENEQKHPSRCSEDDCLNWTCPSCKSICDACDNTLCNEHSYGHGVKDGTYCLEDVGDVEEQVNHERYLEEMDQKHRQQMQELEKQIQRIRMEREQNRQDKKTEAEIERQDQEMDHREIELKIKLAKIIQGSKEKTGSGGKGGGQSFREKAGWNRKKAFKNSGGRKNSRGVRKKKKKGSSDDGVPDVFKQVQKKF